MTTKLIGIRQFSQHLSRILREMKEKNIHFVVMRHGKPVANITPFHGVTEQDWIDEGIDVEALERDIAEAREEAKRGEVYTTEEVRRMLNL